MMFRFAVLAVSIALTSSAFAQVYYNGYNLGPDYGQMLEGALQQNRQLDENMRQTESYIVQQTMQNPDCYQKYQYHLATGGQLTYEQFAYQYAATGGFTREGLGVFTDNERDIARRNQQFMETLIPQE